MRMSPKDSIRWLSGCLIFLVASCREAPSYPAIVVTAEDSLRKVQVIQRAWDSLAAIRAILTSGDLITRTGNDFTSETFRKMNQHDQTYSHCGIVSIEGDSAFVYHSLGGEWNPDQKIRRDPLSVFAEPYNNKGIGLYSFRVPESVKKDIVIMTQNLYKKGVRFDLRFDLETDDRMYCAEFVSKCFSRGSHGLLLFEPSRIGKRAFYGVDNIYLHPLCRPVRQLVYK